MFSSKGFFSEIICPHFKECHIPQCIFSHHLPNDTSAHVTNHDEICLDDEDRNGQRKRRKLDDDSRLPKFSPSPKTKTTPDLKPNKDTSQSQLSPSGRISPPPLRRKVLHQTPSTLKQSPKLETPLSQPKEKSDRKALTESPIKKEGLNPRQLGGPPPAGHDMRFRLVRALHEHFVRLNSELAKDASAAEEELILSEQALITKALDVEEEAAGLPLIYSNIVKNKIMFYKRMSMKEWVEERQKEVENTKLTRVAAIKNTRISKEPPKPVETGLSKEDELKFLQRLYTPIAGLSKHGYVSLIPTDADIEKARTGVEAAQGWEICDRCKSRFQVFPGRREEDGALASGGCCTYHYGKPYFQERSATEPKAKRVKRYRCCGEAIGDSAGCTQSENHVFKISEVKRLAAVLNFAKTPENLEVISEEPICIDGEMGYTVYGLELIRLTATSWLTGAAIFDVLVKPLGGILDLNSRWSGVWPKNMAEALPWSSDTSGETEGNKKLRMVDSPQAARELLFSHLSPNTPLIGHGLENDLNACRIIHPKIIDTALLYPHTAGLPYRNGLKALMQTHLNRHIQVVVDGKMEGHDSKEDANAAGELVKFALKNEWEALKREGWTVQDGVFRHSTTKESLFGKSSNNPNVGSTEGQTTKIQIPLGPRKRVRDEEGHRGSFGSGIPSGLKKRSREENARPGPSSPAAASPREVIDEALEEGELND